MIKINNLIINKNSQKIINNVSLEINSRSIYGIIGDNGIGKTTFLKAIAGLIDINEGLITYTHNDFISSDKLGYFIGVDYFDTNMTGYDNLYIYLTYKGIKDVKELLIKEWPLGMEKYKFVKVKKYSQGTLQKLGIIAATIAPSYTLILLDEPHNSLDPKSILQLRRYIETLNDKGITFIISSHTIGELTKICEKIFLMKKDNEVTEIVKKDFSILDKFIERK